MQIAIAGEALIDFTSTGPLAFQGHAGGSLLNQAVAAARLGLSTGFIGQVSTDLFGDFLMDVLRENEVDARFVVRTPANTTVGFVQHTPTTNRYVFLRKEAADAGWSPSPLPELPAETQVIHFGSISLLQEPAAGAYARLMEQSARKRLVVLDPNVRTSLIADLPAYRAAFLRWLRSTDLLKLSDEDVEALAPGEPPGAAADRWLQAGPKAVIITYGGSGAILHRPGKAPLSVSAPAVAVVDTVGAGDTFSAGVSAALLERGVRTAADLAALPDERWLETLRFAAAAAALNCTRAGCNPPRRPEVLAFLGWAR